MLAVVLSLSLVRCGEKNSEAETTDIVTETIKGEEVTPTEKKSNRKPLTVVITNLPSADAPVVLGLYQENDQFLHDEGRLKAYTFIPKGKTLTAQITD